MSMGFEVFNEEGYKVAGSDFPNLCFYGKGRVDVPTAGIDVPMAQGGEVNFYKSSAPLVEKGGRLYLCSPAYFTSGRWWSSGNTTSGWIEYFSFGRPNKGSSVEVFGVEVYDENGNPTFNSDRLFLNMVGVKSVSKDEYEVYGKGSRTYLPFWEDLGFSGDLAFSIGNTRVYFTTEEVIIDRRVYTYKIDSIRGVHIDNQGRFATTRLIDRYRWFGQAGSNFSSRGNLEILIADVSGL